MVSQIRIGPATARTQGPRHFAPFVNMPKGPMQGMPMGGMGGMPGMPGMRAQYAPAPYAAQPQSGYPKVREMICVLCRVDVLLQEWSAGNPGYPMGDPYNFGAMGAALDGPSW